MKDPLPNRRRWDASGYHPFTAHDGNGLRHPLNKCVICIQSRGSDLHSRHIPRDEVS